MELLVGSFWLGVFDWGLLVESLHLGALGMFGVAFGWELLVGSVWLGASIWEVWVWC